MKGRKEVKIRRLSDLKIGEKGTVLDIDRKSALYKRFLDIGIIKGTKITCVGKSPLKDPAAYLIKGAVIAIRNCDSYSIIIT